MTEWATFAGFTGVVLVLLLLLAHASQRMLSPGEASRIEEADLSKHASYGLGPNEADASSPPGDDSSATADDAAARNSTEAADGSTVAPDGPVTTADDRTVSPDGQTVASGDRITDESESPAGGRALDLSTAELLANVAISQGLFLGVLVIGIWLTNVPLVALGIAPAGASVSALDRTSWGVGVAALAGGVGVGGALYVFNEGGAALGDRIGLGSSEQLREALAPDNTRGWAVLLLVVLPIVAGFEELLFRGALIGALAVGAAETGVVTSASTGVVPWVLAVGSSIAFALGHGAQGRGGIAVTGVLGFALAAVFVTTWSLPLVFVAHYLVNALEFVVHEGLDVDWT